MRNMRRQDYNKRKPYNDNRGPRNQSNQRGILDMAPGLLGNQNLLMGGQAGLLGSQAGLMSQGNLLGGQAGMFGNQGGLLSDHGGLLGSQAGNMMGGGGPGSIMGNQAELLRSQLGMLDNAGMLGMMGQDLVGNQNLLSMLGNQGLNNLMGSQLNGMGLNALQGLVGNQGDAIASLLGEGVRGMDRQRPNDWMRAATGQAGILGPPPDKRRVMPLISGDDGEVGRRPGPGHQMMQLQGSKQGGGSNRDGNTCSICNWTFQTTYAQHCETTGHQKKARLIKKGCILCKTGKFKTYPEYVKHLDSAKHKQNKIELNEELKAKRQAETEGRKETTPGTPNKKSGAKRPEPEPTPVEDDDDDDVIHVPEEEQKMDDINEGDYDVAVKDRPLVYNPNVAVGLEHIISVTGFFCKLCRKFYNNEAAAKGAHSKSEAHFNKYQESLQLK